MEDVKSHKQRPATIHPKAGLRSACWVRSRYQVDRICRNAKGQEAIPTRVDSLKGIRQGNGEHLNANLFILFASALFENFHVAVKCGPSC